MDPDNEDDVVESSCVESKDVEIRTRDRLKLGKEVAVIPDSTEPIIEPFWPDR